MEPAEVDAHCMTVSGVRLGSPSPISVPDASWVGLVELGLALTLPSYRTYIPGLQQGWGPALVCAHPFVFFYGSVQKKQGWYPSPCQPTVCKSASPTHTTPAVAARHNCCGIHL